MAFLSKEGIFMDYVRQYIEALVSLTNEMSPYLILGFIFAGVLHVFFPSGKVNSMLGKNNFGAVLKAALIGIPLPLCSCGVIPTGVSLYKHGASKGSTVSFLISTPQTGVDSVMVTYSLIGLPFAILRVVVALVTGIVGGLATSIVAKNSQAQVSSSEGLSNNETRDAKNPFYEMFRYAFVDFIKDIAKWLVIGLLIAALITVVVPDDFFTMYVGNNVLSMLVILLVSVPLYVCATGSVPIAAALLMKGISPGAALVFLMAGPATNAATITVIAKVLGRRTLVAYLVSIIGGALLFGFITDLLFTPGYLMGLMDHQSAHGHHEFLPRWLQLASTGILVFFTIKALASPLIGRFHASKNKFNLNEGHYMKDDMEITEMVVSGMNCNHCKASVENGLKQLKWVKDIVADINGQKVTITGWPVQVDEVKKVVESLGYTFGGVIT